MKPPTSRPRFNTRPFELLLGVCGIVLLGWWTAVMIDANAYQARASREFDASQAANAESTEGTPPDGAAQRTAKPRRAARSQGVLGRLLIPRAGISVMIAEGTSQGTLHRAVGHVSGTSMPGGPGPAVLAGHRDTFFKGLSHVRPGDGIHVVTADGAFDYRVKSTSIVPPRNVGVMRGSGRSTLLLITCYPFEFIGTAPLRYVVRAELTGAPRPHTG